MILFGKLYDRKIEIDGADVQEIAKKLSNFEGKMEALGIPIKIIITVQISFPEPEKGGKK